MKTQAPNNKAPNLPVAYPYPPQPTITTMNPSNTPQPHCIHSIRKLYSLKTTHQCFLFGAFPFNNPLSNQIIIIRLQEKKMTRYAAYAVQLHICSDSQYDAKHSYLPDPTSRQGRPHNQLVFFEKNQLLSPDEGLSQCFALCQLKFCNASVYTHTESRKDSLQTEIFNIRDFNLGGQPQNTWSQTNFAFSVLSCYRPIACC